jgi:hypothetical protein
MRMGEISPFTRKTKMVKISARMMRVEAVVKKNGKEVLSKNIEADYIYATVLGKDSILFGYQVKDTCFAAYS